MWMMLWGNYMLVVESISNYHFGMLKNEIYGGLCGEPPKDLQIDRANHN
jgi:hypothetical protein